MRKLLGMAIALAMLCAAASAQRGTGMQFRGIPGSVTSPRSDGSLRGIPASVTDPRAANGIGFRGSLTFGNTRPFAQHHRRPAPVFVVPYYAYPYVYDSSLYEEPQQQQQVQPQVIVIKDETSRAADSRYGEHSFDGHDAEATHDEPANSKPAPAPAEVTDLGPMTTLVFRDGHKSEVRNYAIVGANLLDLTRSPVMKKIPLASLDLDATRRENEDNGVDFHLP